MVSSTAVKTSAKLVKKKLSPIEKAQLSVESEVAFKGEDEVILTDAEGRRYCGVADCDQVATVETYCRYHYLLFWNQIQVRKQILSDGKLGKYIQELTAYFADKFIEVLKKDLSSQKNFLSVIHELDLDKRSLDKPDDEDQGLMDEVSGMGVEAHSDKDF